MRVSTCCCGCSLELGCKIIAILGLIVGGLELILGIADIALRGQDLVSEVSENLFYANFIHGVLYIIAAGLILWGAQ